MNFYTKKIISPGKCFVFPGMVLICVLLAFAGCNKEDMPGGETPDFSHIKPKATAKGDIAGVLVTKLIGSGGGEVLSADGRMKLVIPAGALDANTNIGIQPITNMAPLGLGNNYRLTPEGINFSKPVTLVFNYNEVALTTSIPEFLWVVTQNADGTWAGGRKSIVNKTGKTVSVTTTHFSDWGIGRFMDLALKPAATTVKRGESVLLSITGFKYDPDEDDFPPLANIDSDLVGLNEAQQLLLSTEEYLTFRVKYWALNETKAPADNKKGKLVVSGKKATYTAPSETPDPATVTVSVNMEAKDNSGSWHAYTLLSNITVTGDYYLKMSINGGDYVYAADNNAVRYAPFATVSQSGILEWTGTTKNSTGGIFSFKTKINTTGSFKVDIDKGDMLKFFPENFSAQNTLHYTVDDMDYQRYQNGLCYLTSKKSSPFTFTITRFDPTGSNISGRVIEGSFLGELGEMTADWMEKECKANDRKVTVTGEFKLQFFSN